MVEVPAASPQRLQALRTRLMDRLADQSLDVLPRRSLAEQLGHCRHPELLPVAYALTGRDDSSVDAADAISTMAQSSPAVRASVIDYLCGASPKKAPLLFSRVLTHGTVQLRADETRHLLDAPNPWVRASAWATGDKEVAQRSSDSVLGGLRSLTPRSDSALFQGLLERLAASKQAEACAPPDPASNGGSGGL
jgi:hypothetical protein